MRVTDERLAEHIAMAKKNRQYLIDNGWGAQHVPLIDEQIAMLEELQQLRHAPISSDPMTYPLRQLEWRERRALLGTFIDGFGVFGKFTEIDTRYGSAKDIAYMKIEAEEKYESGLRKVISGDMTPYAPPERDKILVEADTILEKLRQEQ